MATLYHERFAAIAFEHLQERSVQPVASLDNVMDGLSQSLHHWEQLPADILEQLDVARLYQFDKALLNELQFRPAGMNNEPTKTEVAEKLKLAPVFKRIQCEAQAIQSTVRKKVEAIDSNGHCRSGVESIRRYSFDVTSKVYESILADKDLVKRFGGQF